MANACTHPDLFWGLKGGGGGSLGVVTKLTLRTRELPDRFGAVFGTIGAASDETFQRLLARLIAFIRDQLFNPRWGSSWCLDPGTPSGSRWCSRASTGRALSASGSRSRSGSPARLRNSRSRRR